jgi:hypothetical protein
MNQNNSRVEEILAKKLHALETDWSDGCYIRGEDVDAICDYIHQELQKARHNWLRKEIVKLRAVQEPNVGKENKPFHHRTRHNKALQTIMDRYLSELDQPNK